jgi:hypothetical protein
VPVAAKPICRATGEASAIVHKDQVGAQPAREGESFALADVECAPRRIVSGQRYGPYI